MSFLAELRRRMERMFVLLLALALGLFAFDRFALAPRREAALVAATTETAEAEAGAGKQAASSEKAIAVLPFVNMSADRDDEYCSDGIAEEILNALIELGELKTVSVDVIFRKKDYDGMVEKIRTELQSKETITLGEIRDMLNTTRKYIQALLEHLDAIGVTMRDGDARKLRK